MDKGRVSRKTRWMAFVVALVMLCGMFAAMPAQAAGITSKKPKISAKSAYINSKVYLKWAKVSGAAKYQVYRSTSKGGTYKLFTTTTKTSVNKTSSSAYYYKVRAVKGKQYSKFSDPVYVFAANGRITNVYYGSSLPCIILRVTVSNKSKKTMSFLGTDTPIGYMVEKSSGKVAAKSYTANISTKLDRYGISVGMGKQIKAKGSGSIYVYVYTSAWGRMFYENDPSKYTWLVTLPFYPGGGNTSVSKVMALAAGQKAADSSIAVK